MARKYPSLIYKIQAQSVRIPTEQLISQAKSERKQTQEMALEVHKLVSNLWKGPAGSTDDLRSAEYHLDMAELALEQGGGGEVPRFEFKNEFNAVSIDPRQLQSIQFTQSIAP